MPDARSLFRPEALEARRQQWLGRTQLVRPLSLTWLTIGVVAVAVALVVFLFATHYTRKTTAVGVVVPDRGLIRLVTPAAGTVIERHAAEGQTVAAGDVLFVVAVERPSLGPQAQAQVDRSIDERRRSLRSAARQEESLVRARQAALERRLQALELETAQVDAEAALQRQRLALARESLVRLESLQAQQFISAAQVQAKSEEVLGIRAAAQALARQRAALARERAELEGEARTVPLTAGNVVGGIEREIAMLSREAAEQDGERRVVVRAPQAGTVSALLAEPGQSVTPSSALASLVPSGAVLQAQLFAPSSAIGFVRPGQSVQLRFEAFPYQKFGHGIGTVVQVSRTPLAPSELAALSVPAVAAGGEPMFRITVELPDTPQRAAIELTPGMRLEADVMLDRRRLVEWMFEPLLGLGSRW